MELNLNEVIEDQIKALPPKEKLSQLSVMAQKQLDLEQTIAAKEEEIKELNAQLVKVSEDAIPQLMGALGIRQVKLTNGLILSVSKFYSAKITDDAAYVWLENNNYGDIIKGQVSVKYPKETNKELIEKICTFIEKEGFIAENKIEVHHSTLRAWVKEVIEEGVQIPRELFNVYVGERSKLSLK